MLVIPVYDLALLPGASLYLKKEYYEELAGKQAEQGASVIFLMLKQHKQRPCLFSRPPASEQSDTQIHDLHAKQFIQKLHAELPEQIGKISRKSFVNTELYHLIPPDISTLSII